MSFHTSVAVDVESKALVESEHEKNATIVEVRRPGFNNEAKLDRGSALRQVIAAFVANLGTINTGLVFGFSAVAIPQLEEADSFIKIDEEQASWIASLSSVSTPIGCILSGYLMDLIGRKRTLIMTEIPLIIGWLLISTSSTVEMIYVGRLLVGLGSGMVGAPARVYTGEVTQPHLRGMLSALASVGVSLGVTIEYALGAIVTWTVLAGISAAIPILALILIVFMPETPNWLLNHGRTEEAREALKKFRGETCDVDKEMGILVDFAAKNNVVQLKSFKETLRALTSPAALKPFIILFTYFGIYQFSGVNPVTFYAVQVFQESGAEMNKYLATVILGIVRLLSTIAACISLRTCGRRPLTLISAIGCGLTMIGLGSYMYVREGWVAEGVQPTATWIPVACIFIFTVASTLGYLVVPWVMIGEVYPTQVRGIIGGLTTCSAHLFVFMVVKTFPLIQHIASNHGSFWIYGSISLLGTIFFYLCLPETKGRTLQEIEDYFSGRTKTLGGKGTKTLPGNKPKILEAEKGSMLP
ncbi:facilitated trehalose transporter Tret1-2 homolog isoform X1 [Cryptotermes secundus]|uniref:facilitated trehalose transporter Tret1-2 homolog isoform X1 n=1 Tax=Cryptotermes secundus TaxID=105785 RepID=UPI000CD7B8A4|nr:facilitated trehalose transporter Tret1-2 homolog isoform X1 [Cryptotermes secundus]